MGQQCYTPLVQLQGRGSKCPWQFTFCSLVAFCPRPQMASDLGRNITHVSPRCAISTKKKKTEFTVASGHANSLLKPGDCNCVSDSETCYLGPKPRCNAWFIETLAPKQGFRDHVAPSNNFWKPNHISFSDVSWRIGLIFPGGRVLGRPVAKPARATFFRTVPFVSLPKTS